MNRRLRALFCALLLVPSCALAATTSFRGGAAHEGVFDSRPVRRQPALRWRFDTRGPVRSSPTVAGALVLVGSGDGGLYGVDATSGRQVWRFATSGSVDSSPAVAGDTAVFASRDRHVYAVDLATGAERWRVATGEELPFPWGYEYFLSSPAVSGDDVVVGAGDGILYCLSIASGEVRWRFRTEGRVRSSPAVSGGVVFVGSMDGRLYAVDARTGALVWKFDTDGVAIDSVKEGYDRCTINSSPAVSDGVVTFGSRDGRQYAVDEKTGRLLWKVGHAVGWLPGNPEVSWVDASPAVSNGVAYVGASDGRFVDAKELRTGRELWRFPTPDRANASPSLAGGTLIAGCADGAVYAIDAKTGAELWRFRTRDGVYSSPTISRGVVFVGSDDGSLYAISDEDASGRPVPSRAVFYDEKASGFHFAGGRRLSDALVAESYTPLDARALAGYLEARVADRAPSVVVFASEALPTEVVDASAGSACLLRRYLDTGGRVVWVGLPPLLVKLDVATGKLARMDAAAPRQVLGVDSNLAPADADEYYSTATSEGAAWGLPSWGTYCFPVDPKDVTTVLARTASGRATAWVKAFGAGEFVRLWGRERPIPDPSVVRRVAEHGL